MSQVSVTNPSGYYSNVSQYNIECPFCHSYIVPNYLCLDHDTLYASCPNEDCKRHFVLSLNKGTGFTSVEPNAIPKSKAFSETISKISGQFATIYNQAYYAEQMGLDQICGVGYRKAIEFLIKDYLISKETDAQKIEIIKNKFLGNCIKDDVQDKNIREVAKRAVWIGNDETHYVRVWADKDVQNLKQLIELTVRWIENEIETEQVLQEINR